VIRSPRGGGGAGWGWSGVSAGEAPAGARRAGQEALDALRKETDAKRREQEAAARPGTPSDPFSP